MCCKEEYECLPNLRVLHGGVCAVVDSEWRGVHSVFLLLYMVVFVANRPFTDDTFALAEHTVTNGG